MGSISGRRWNASIAELAAYAFERIAKLRVALLVALVASLGFAAELPASAAQALVRVALVALLVIQSRLWDDIADREHDRARHPERVLARHAGRATAFLALLGALSVPIVALLCTFPDPEWRIAAYGALALALAVVYGSRASAHGRVMRMGWVLLKYPVFVLLPLASPTSRGAFVAAAIAYLVAMMSDWVVSPDAVDLRRGRAAKPWPEMFEAVACYACGSHDASPLVSAEDDLAGGPGRFTFVRCGNCRLAYQNPRLKREYARVERLSPPDAHDREKLAIARRYVDLGASSEVLDVGSDPESEGFRTLLRERCYAGVTGMDRPIYDVVPGARYDLVTMWDGLEREYDPPRALRAARDLLAPAGLLIVEVPRLDSRTWKLFRERWPGLDAPRNTVLFTRQSLEAMVDAAGLVVVDYLPYGSHPSYLYLFAGAAYKLLKGRGLDLRRVAVPYFLGRVLLSPLLAFERHLNLAMQIVVCRRR